MSETIDVTTQPGHYIQANGLKMYYEDYGSGTPLILIHGAMATSMQWKAYLPFLSRHFRLIMLDQRGHGRTDNPHGEIRLPMLTDDLTAFIKALGFTKPFLCGWSTGGDVALDAVIHNPDLVQAMAVGGITHRVSEMYFESLKATGVDGPGKVNIEQAEKAMPQLVEFLRVAHAQGPNYWKALLTQLSYEMTEPTLPSRDEIRKTTTPTLIIWGDRDQYLPIENAVELYRLMPNAELAVLPNADHSISRTRIEQFANLLKEFLLRHIESSNQNDDGVC